MEICGRKLKLKIVLNYLKTFFLDLSKEKEVEGSRRRRYC